MTLEALPGCTVKQCAGESSCPFSCPFMLDKCTHRDVSPWATTVGSFINIHLNLIISCDIMGWGNTSNLTVNMAANTFGAKTTLLLGMQRSH